MEIHKHGLAEQTMGAAGPSTSSGSRVRSWKFCFSYVCCFSLSLFSLIVVLLLFDVVLPKKRVSTCLSSFLHNDNKNLDILVLLLQYCWPNINARSQWAMAQLALPPPIIMGWRVRSWVQDPLGHCVTYQWYLYMCMGRLQTSFSTSFSVADRCLSYRV